MGKRGTPESGSPRAVAGRFPRDLMHAAAMMYYVREATQADIAEHLGVSRPTVSRLLAEARRTGLVRIEIAPLVDDETRDVAARTAAALDLRHVELAGVTTGAMLGPSMASALSAVLRQVSPVPGDVVLVASGRTVYETTRAELASLPGVVIVPTVGGQDEPDAWFQINEIARQFAANVGGHPTFLHAPALPSPELHSTLMNDTATAHVIALWGEARCAIVGIGAPPLQRSSIARSIPTDAAALRRAVGDVCLRFFDVDGEPVEFPGSERLIATPLSLLRNVPVTIALAVGIEKVVGIIASARARYITDLVTDVPTALAVLGSVNGYRAR